MFRVRSRGAHDIAATHAKADGAQAAAPHPLHAVQELHDGTGVVHDHLVAEFRPRLDLAERLPFKPIYRNGLILFVSKLEMHPFTIAIVEVRHHAVISDCPDATGDVVEFIAQPPNVHVKDHRRKGSVLFRVCDKGLHHSFGSLDLDELFLHLGAFRGFVIDHKTHAKSICKRPGNNPLYCISLFPWGLDSSPLFFVHVAQTV